MTDDEQFDYFWDLYGKKVARPVARKAWDKLTLLERHDACVGLKDRVAHDREWLVKDDDGRPGKFKPRASTYLNQHRWEDHWERHIPRAFRPDNVRDTTKGLDLCPNCRSHLSSDYHQRECVQAEQLMDQKSD